MWSLNKGRRGMSTRTKQQAFFHIVKSGTEIAVHMKDVPTIMPDVQKYDFLPPAKRKCMQQIP